MRATANAETGAPVLIAIGARVLVGVGARVLVGIGARVLVGIGARVLVGIGARVLAMSHGYDALSAAGTFDIAISIHCFAVRS